MKITKEELGQMRCLNNMLIIKPEKIFNCVSKTGIILLPDREGNIMYHIGVWGEVIKQPDILTYSKEMANGKMDMPWDVPIETMVGDKVAFTYVGIYDALGKLADPCKAVDTGKYFWVNDELYVFLHYKHMILSKRGEDIIPLNGFCLVEGVEEDDVKTTLIIPDYLKKKISANRGKIFKPGCMVKDYEGDAYLPDRGDLKEGDIIVYDKFNNIEVEASEHKQLDKIYYRIQRRNIACKLVDDKIKLL